MVDVWRTTVEKGDDGSERRTEIVDEKKGERGKGKEEAEKAEEEREREMGNGNVNMGNLLKG